MKFILFVEGHTEKKSLPAFLKRWLDPQLSQPIGIKTVRFEGWADFRRDVRKKALLYLNDPRHSDIRAVIGLIDLYGPTFYPGHLTAADERYIWAKKEIEAEVGHPKFRQFFAVHETEAWLLSNPDLFPAKIKSALPGRVAQPETVNFNEPPAKLLDKLYREKLNQIYKKTTFGKELFDSLEPSTVYARCQKFRELLDEMLLLASLP
jgi:hypothetical protein